MENRDALINKLNALRAKANQAGTPEEAATFMAGYVRLMEKYKLTETDLEVKSAGVTGAERKAKGGNTTQTRSPMGWVVLKIAELTETKIVALKGMNGWVFVGIPTDVQYATWIYDLVSNTMDRGAVAYKMTPDYHKRINAGSKGADAIHAYKHGFRVAINKTLQKMIDENKVAGNALVVLKHGLIEAFLNGKETAEPSKSKGIVIHNDLNEVSHMGYNDGKEIKLRQSVNTETTLLLK